MRVEAGDTVYFVKYGTGEVAETLGAEAAGLLALREASSPLVIPEVIAHAQEVTGCPGFLVLTWIETRRGGSAYGRTLGEGLAALHRYTSHRYGFDRANFIGRMPQSNRWADTWPAFFRAERLEPQASWARERGRWAASWDAPFEILLRRLDEVLPVTPPASLLHGDLWSGNALATADGQAAIIDPAVYYGHREADLALTELFGGFPPSFYDAYRSEWPLEPGYEERRSVYNLYHLLNHLNLFGGSYAGSVASTLRRFA